MMKILLLLTCVIGVNLVSTASTSIECDYKTRDWHIVKNSYYCDVQNDPNNKTRESAVITSVTGIHQNEKSNSDVNGFYVWSKTCHYFPNGLDKFSQTFKLIQIMASDLKEVHQEDLKPFPKLVELMLNYNSLEVLEKGVLDFNPDLEYIDFDGNKIVHIGPKILDHLSKLSYLYLQLNNCIDKAAGNSLSEVKKVIQTVKSQCISSKIESLENLQYLSSKEIKTIRDEFTFNFVEMLTAVKLKADKMDEQIEEIKKQNRKFEDKLSKIMKALSIAE